VRTAEAFTRGISKQQEGYRALTQQWVGAYRDFFSPFSYVQGSMRTFQRATQQGLEATQQGLLGSRGGHRADREGPAAD
jgi:hypothetical protein